MYSLFIDTHKSTHVGLFKDKKLLKQLDSFSKEQSTLIMPLIDELLNDCEIDIKEINEILLVNGPGSFTGVRLGVTIAKTLAYCLDIPIKTITSLQLKAIMKDYDNTMYFGSKDIKGAFVCQFDSNKDEINDYKYLSNDELKEIDVVTDVTYYLNNIYFYENKFKETKPHEVKPFYVKKIEVEK